MISFDEVFSSVKQYCREKGAIPDVAVKLWINALHPVRLDGNVALFTVQSSFQRDVILGNYGDLLKEAFLNTLGLAVDIQIQVVDEEDQEVQEKFKTNDYDEIARRHEELEHTFEGANYEYTFDTFIVGGSNEFAYAACTAVAKEPGKNYNPLFIYGPSGLGKTHLMHAIANQVHENHPDYKIIYVTSEEFGNDLISSINDNNTALFHDKYRNATCCSLTISSSSATRSECRKSSSTPSTSCTLRQADRHHIGQAAQGAENPGGSYPQPVRMGTHHRYQHAGFRDTHRHHPPEGRAFGSVHSG